MLAKNNIYCYSWLFFLFYTEFYTCFLFSYFRSQIYFLNKF
nr:MAG TPA: hypothetical protein [Caudoviricetes sp.]